MKKRVLKTIIPIFVYFFIANAFGQYRDSKEVGIFVGPAFFATDYGVAGDSQSYLKNSGIGIGFLYYINFSEYSSNYWRGGGSAYQYFIDHFKLRTEFSFTSAKLEQNGKWAESRSEGGVKLSAMKGKATFLNIGAQLEFHLLEKSLPRRFFSPYASIGFMINYYKPSLESDLGDWESDPSVLPYPWVNPDYVSLDGGLGASITAALGGRFKINDFSDVILEARWQGFTTDWLEGLNADVPQNKKNDWVFFPHIGYIYYIQ